MGRLDRVAAAPFSRGTLFVPVAPSWLRKLRRATAALGRKGKSSVPERGNGVAHPVDLCGRAIGDQHAGGVAGLCDHQPPRIDHERPTMAGSIGGMTAALGGRQNVGLALDGARAEQDEWRERAARSASAHLEWTSRCAVLVDAVVLVVRRELLLPRHCCTVAVNVSVSPPPMVMLSKSSRCPPPQTKVPTRLSSLEPRLVATAWQVGLRRHG